MAFAAYLLENGLKVGGHLHTFLSHTMGFLYELSG